MNFELRQSQCMSSQCRILPSLHLVAPIVWAGIAVALPGPAYCRAVAHCSVKERKLHEQRLSQDILLNAVQGPQLLLRKSSESLKGGASSDARCRKRFPAVSLMSCENLRRNCDRQTLENTAANESQQQSAKHCNSACAFKIRPSLRMKPLSAGLP